MLSKNYLRVFHPEWPVSPEIWENDGGRKWVHEREDSRGRCGVVRTVLRGGRSVTADRGLRVAVDRLSDGDVGETYESKA